MIQSRCLADRSRSWSRLAVKAKPIQTNGGASASLIRVPLTEVIGTCA